MPKESRRVRSRFHQPLDCLRAGARQNAVQRVLQLAEHRGRADDQHHDVDYGREHAFLRDRHPG
jgi:hypothetical protein